MGDDVNAPNPDTFILPDTLAEFVNIVYDKLPFGRWDCYLGKYIKKHDDNWHEEIVNYPYLYFYKKD